MHRWPTFVGEWLNEPVIWLWWRHWPVRWHPRLAVNNGKSLTHFLSLSLFLFPFRSRAIFVQCVFQSNLVLFICFWQHLFSLSLSFAFYNYNTYKIEKKRKSVREGEWVNSKKELTAIAVQTHAGQGRSSGGHKLKRASAIGCCLLQITSSQW